MEKRYQVFVSSTYEDLPEARREVMNALLELDAIPAGMELFPAANEDQWSLIKRVIDDCDYYIVIVAGRYGSCDANGIGYTEKEYRYALESRKPILAFLHKDPETLEAKRTEKSPESRQKLADFRALAEQKMCKYWATPSELGSVVSRSLVRMIKTSPGIGWVRADALPDKETSLELLELRKRVDELGAELAAAANEAPAGTDEFAQGNDLFEIHYSFMASDNRFAMQTGTSSFVATWNDVFAAVSPLLIDEADEHTMHQAVDSFVRIQTEAELLQDSRMKGKSIRSFAIREDDFQTIKVQLRALGLIVKSVRQRSVKDTSTYWTLTPYGDAQLVKLRAIRKAVREPVTPNRTRRKKGSIAMADA